MISVPARTAAMKFDSIVNKVTMFCSLLAQLTALVPNLVRNPEVDHPLLGFPPWSVSVHVWNGLAERSDVKVSARSMLPFR